MFVCTCVVRLGYHNKNHMLDGLDNTNLVSHSSGGQATTHFIFCWGSSSWPPSCCLLTWQREKEKEKGSSLVTLLKGKLIPSWNFHSKPNTFQLPWVWRLQELCVMAKRVILALRNWSQSGLLTTILLLPCLKPHTPKKDFNKWILECLLRGGEWYLIQYIATCSNGF
jgi:hypothetical protein